MLVEVVSVGELAGPKEADENSPIPSPEDDINGEAQARVEQVVMGEEREISGS